ncbi:hypothetical protein [Fibrella aquatica]|uniref:hypothetical protein n=1 Tax=Fibrella aquatica TaxID=3242487 RepID=UPI0035230F0A
MNPLDRLHLITGKLLDSAPDAYGDLWTLTRQLYDLLFELTALDPDQDSNRQSDQFLTTGRAVGLTWAAMCIHDLMRTKKFMDGLYKAVLDKQKAAPGAPVHVLYAGTGPFATLILPLLARFTSQQVQFTFLEVNPESFHCLTELVALLGIGPYVRHFHLTDATTWQAATDEPVAILVTETMQRALKNEPQVAICLSLLPQLSPETILIPEEISLKLGLVSYQLSDQLTPAVIRPLAEVFSLTKSTVLGNAAAYRKIGIPYYFPETTFIVPPQLVDDSSQFTLLTDIVIYQDVVLGYNESGLTTAHPLKLATEDVPASLTFRYQVDKTPGLELMTTLEQRGHN